MIVSIFRLIVVLLAVALLQSYANATPVPPSAPAPVRVSPPAPARTVVSVPSTLRYGYVCTSGRCSRVQVTATQSSKQQGKKPVRLLSRPVFSRKH